MIIQWLNNEAMNRVVAWLAHAYWITTTYGFNRKCIANEDLHLIHEYNMCKILYISIKLEEWKV